VKTVLQLYAVLKPPPPPPPPTLRHPPARTRATAQILGGAQRRGNLPPAPGTEVQPAPHTGPLSASSP